jgi:hypothetical protein
MGSKQMTQENKNERRRRVARHVFEALCTKYPEKHIVLMQPGEAATGQVVTEAPSERPATS